MQLKVAPLPAAQHGLGRLLRGEQGGHGEVVLPRQRGIDKTRVHHAHPHPLRAQVQKQGFGQVNERCLGRAIGQALRQTAPTRHTGHQAQVRRAPGLGRGQQARHHSGQQVQRSGQVHLLVAQQLGQGQRVGAHGGVVARAVAHQVQRPLVLQVIGCVLHCLGIGHVQHQGLATGVLLHKRIQQRLLACRNDHLGTLGVQLRGHGAANAAGGTHQPHTLAAPVGDSRVQRHGATPYCLVNESNTSPRVTPNLLMVARLSSTRSSTKNIQSSNCTSYSLPSTGRRRV